MDTATKLTDIAKRKAQLVSDYVEAKTVLEHIKNLKEKEADAINITEKFATEIEQLMLEENAVLSNVEKQEV